MALKKDAAIDPQRVCRIHGGRASATVSVDSLEQIELLAKELGFDEIHALRAADIVIARWVGLKCRYGCANYNTNWCCPPAAPDLDTVRELLSEYEVALLLARQHRNEEFYRNSEAKRRFQIKQWKSTVALERKLFLMGYYKAFGLPAETCALCKKCSYPDRCKFPNEKRPAVEACSIDVFQTIKCLGRSFELAGSVKDTYNSYSLILLA
jgi:predicted metal-binding protein